jgi:hypothetical protein
MENNKRRIEIYNHTELSLVLIGQILAQLLAEEMQYEDLGDGKVREEFGAFYIDDGYQYRYCLQALKRHNRITIWRSDLNE